MKYMLLAATVGLGLAACGGDAVPQDRVRANDQQRVVVADNCTTGHALVAPGGKYAGYAMDCGPGEYDSSYGR